MTHAWIFSAGADVEDSGRQIAEAGHRHRLEPRLLRRFSRVGHLSGGIDYRVPPNDAMERHSSGWKAEHGRSQHADGEKP